MSNFYLVPITYEGMKFASVEHAYQSAKTLDPTERIRFTSPLLTAGQAKRLGRKVTIRSDWENEKLNVMETLLRIKFTNPLLASALLRTIPHDLIEGNDWGDRFWGVCKGKGENHLGKLLMKIRAELRERG